MKTSLFPARSRQGAKLRDTASTFNFFLPYLKKTIHLFELYLQDEISASLMRLLAAFVFGSP